METSSQITGHDLINFIGGIFSILLIFPLFYVTYLAFQKSGELIYQYKITDEYFEIRRFFLYTVLRIHSSEIEKYNFKVAQSVILSNFIVKDEMYLSNTQRDFLILEPKFQKRLIVVSPKKSTELLNFLSKISN